MSVKVVCIKCGSVGRIESSPQEAETVKKLYCSCSDPECGHSWVMDLTFSHTLSLSALALDIQFRVKNHHVPPVEQVKLFAGLG